MDVNLLNKSSPQDQPKTKTEDIASPSTYSIDARSRTYLKGVLTRFIYVCIAQLERLTELFI